MLRGTEFAEYESIFDDAWNHILNAIVTANKYQIGVLLGKARSYQCTLVFLEIFRSYRQTCMRPPGSRYVVIAEMSAQGLTAQSDMKEPRLSLRDL